jgi:tetratricopeptide (TPR) repeat protein
MAKNKTNKTIAKKESVIADIPSAPLPLAEKKSNYSFDNFTLQALLLVIIGFFIYSNSIDNEYALDDGIVIQGNEYVQKGFSGIGKILTTDAYDSFYKQMGASQQLAGGRYRPLSIVTFAIEQSLFGTEANAKTAMDIAYIRHFFNVFFYIVSIVVLLYFLRNYIFKKNPLIAFIATLLFLIHPIHTEVIANAKSRDEIISFLFIILTFIFALNYRDSKSKVQLGLGLLFYFLACLSKEYAITLVVLLPMLFFIVKKDSLPDSIVTSIPFFVIALLYLLIRFRIVGAGAATESPDVLNAPFKFARGNQRLATKIEILDHYLKLLFYPDPLSSDYSYNSIPYKNFKDWKVWLSIVIHISLVVATIKLFFKRNILAFALAMYLLNLFMVSNLLMEIGATMGERLVYHSSLGFVMAIAIGTVWLFDKIKNTNVRTGVAIATGLIVTIWCSEKVIARNAQWKNDTSLFMADVETVPNSVLVNGNIGKAYYDISQKPENKAKEKELIYKGISHLEKAVSIHPKYVNGYINLGVAYYALKDFDKAKKYWEITRELYPNNPYLLNNLRALSFAFYTQAMNTVASNSKDRNTLLKAIKDLESATALDPANPDFRYDLGGLNYMIGNYDKAKADWLEALRINPKHEKALAGLKALTPAR